MSYVIAVDDEVDVLETLGRALERDGHEVKLISNSLDTERAVDTRMPDLLILDIIMPALDGVSICRNLRANRRYEALPILFLTAKGGTDDIVEGLDAGADDYVVKPFHLAELRARVNALLRRGTREAGDEAVIELEGLRLDANTHQIEVEGGSIQLTATEHRLMRYLMQNANKPLSPTHLLEQVWEYPPNTGDPDLVRAHVRNLRAKLKKQSTHKYIQTVHGVGYMVEG